MYYYYLIWKNTFPWRGLNPDLAVENQVSEPVDSKLSEVDVSIRNEKKNWYAPIMKVVICSTKFDMRTFLTFLVNHTEDSREKLAILSYSQEYNYYTHYMVIYKRKTNCQCQDSNLESSAQWWWSMSQPEKWQKASEVTEGKSSRMRWEGKQSKGK